MSTQKQIQNEFDNWVMSNRSEWMQYRHQFLLDGILNHACLQPNSSVLDLCCGEGWAIQQVSRLVRRGIAVGIDISSQMIDKAINASPLGHALFLQADVNHLPFHTKKFTHIYSIESLYYIDKFQDLFTGLHQLLMNDGKLIFSFSYFMENPFTQYWQSHLPIQIYNRSIQTYVGALAHAGFNKIKTERLYDPSPLPQRYEGRWYRDISHLDAFRK